MKIFFFKQSVEAGSISCRKYEVVQNWFKWFKTVFVTILQEVVSMELDKERTAKLCDAHEYPFSQ
jgi:hypothetical protein